MSIATDTGAGGRTTSDPYPSPTIGWYVVGVFVVTYTFSYIDRTILTLLVQPIRASLHISDTEISTLHGLAFALFYTLLGIPIGRLADRRHRVSIIAVGVFTWSLMTVFVGISRNYIQMFLARVGVGIGEAALSPSAYSIMADYHPPNRLPKAMSVYTAAMNIGSGLALIAGGALISLVPPMDLPIVGHLEPWQVVFLCVGAPGLVMVLMMGTVREPVRRGLLKHGGVPTAMPFGAVIKYILDRRDAYIPMIFGYASISMAYNGVNAWIPTFFIRVHHWTAQQAGLDYGLVLGIVGGIGIILGGIVASRMKIAGRRSGNIQAGIIGAIIMLPSGVIAPFLNDAYLALAAYGVFVFGASFPFGAAAASFQELTPNQMRGQVTAIYFFFLNLAGIGIGPTVVASFTDYVFRSDASVNYSMAVIAAVMTPIGIYLLRRALKPFERHTAAAEF